MHKTTLYLPESDVAELKSLSRYFPKKGLTYHIQQAVKLYLRSLRQKKDTQAFAALLKARGSGKRAVFGDSVAYQRRLREEW